VGPRAGLDRCEKSRSHRDRPRTVQPVAQSLYRLSYPDHSYKSVASKFYVPDPSRVTNCLHSNAYPFSKERFLFLNGPQDSPPFPVKSNMKVKMIMNHWWNVTDRRKPKKSEKKNLSHSHFVHHKCYIEQGGIEPGP